MRGCFYYLVNHTDASVADFIISLTGLRTFYLSKFPCPVIAFHEAPLSAGRRRHITSVTGVDVRWQEIRFELPAHIQADRLYGFRPGYMFMCRFCANEVFHHPALAPYTYHCRLDTDSRILSPVKQDLFGAAETQGVQYGFIDDSITDQPAYTSGLWPCAETYLQRHPQWPARGKLYTEIPEGRVYYTNFELCYRPWFQQEPWVSFFNHVDRAGGIFYSRWGDHSIRYLGVKLFMPAAGIRRVVGLHYKHTYEYRFLAGAAMFA